MSDEYNSPDVPVGCFLAMVVFLTTLLALAIGIGEFILKMAGCS